MSTEVGKIHYTLDLDDSKFQKGVDTASTKIKSVGDTVSGVGKKLTTFVTLPLLGVGAASFVMAANLEDAIGATNQIFKDQSTEMQNWAKGLQTYYGISEAQALSYANTMGAMLQNIGGLTQEEAAKQSQTLLELAGDMTAMFGGSTEDAVRALTGALKGNNTMLDNYGMAVNDAMIKTKALELGLMKEGEEMSLTAKQGATLALIQEQSASYTGQAAREAENASGSLRSMKTELQNLGTEIGGVLMPIIMPFIDKLKEAVAWFTGLSDSQKKLIVTIALVVAAIGPILLVLGNLITAVGVVGGVLSGPLIIIFGLVIAAVMLLVDHFGGFQNMINAVKDKLMELWNVISPYLIPVFESMRTMIVDELIPALKEIWNMISPYVIPVLKVLGAILLGVVVVAIGIVIGIIWVIIKLFTLWAESMRDSMNKGKDDIQSFKEKFEEVKNKILGIKDSIVGGFNDLKNKISGSIDSIKEKINGAVEAMKKLNPLQRFSPSLVDNVKRGTHALVREYEGMFADINALSADTRFNLAGATGSVSSITSVNTPQPVSVSVNVDNYYGDQIGLTNFAEKIMKEIDTINLSRSNKLI